MIRILIKAIIKELHLQKQLYMLFTFFAHL